MTPSDATAPAATSQSVGTGQATRSRGWRNQPLEGLRAVGAIAVLVTHLASSASGNQYWYARFTGRLDVGVTIFFVISAYLLYLPFARSLTGDRSRPDVRGYARRRLLRIFPAYLVVMGISAFIYGRGMPMTASQLARYLTLTHIYTPSTFDNPVPQAWSLSTELAFYAFLPIFAFAISRIPASSRSARIRNQWFGLAAMVVVGFAFRAWLVSLEVRVSGQTGSQGVVDPLTVISLKAWIFNHLDTFAVGMGLALIQAGREERSRSASDRGEVTVDGWPGASGRAISIAGAVVALVAFAVVSSSWVDLSVQSLLYSPGQEWARHLLYTAIGGGLVVSAVVGVRSNWFGPRLLGSAPFRFLGRISYGIYLTQILVIGIFLSRRPQDEFAIPIWQMSVFVVPVVLVSSWLLFQLVEQPAMRLGSRRISTFAKGLSAIGAAGLLWRLVSILHITTVLPDGGDPFYYHIQAGLLSAGRGFSEPFRWVQDGTLEPTAIHPPLYSMYLSISSFLGADTYLAHKTLSILAGVGVVVMIGLIARRVGGDWAGWIAAAIAAFYPQFWIVDGILWSEGLFTLFIALTVWAAYLYYDRPSRWGAVWLGLAVSGAVLTRGEALILAPLLVAPLVFFGPRPLRMLKDLRTRWRVRAERSAADDAGEAFDEVERSGEDGRGANDHVLNWRERSLRLVLAALAVTLPIAPWVARNMTAFDEPITISSNSDEVLYYANCVDSYYGDFIGYWSFPCQEREREVVQEPRDEAVRVKFWRDKGIDYAMSHKSRWPVVVAARVGRMLEVYRPAQGARILSIEGRPLGWTQFGQVMWWAMLPLAAAGSWLLRRRGVWTWPLWSQVTMVMAVTVVVYGHVRFRPPLDLAVIVAAAVALASATRWAAPRLLTSPLAARLLASDGPALIELASQPTGAEQAEPVESTDPVEDTDPAEASEPEPPGGNHSRAAAVAAWWRASPGRWWADHPGWRSGVGIAIIAVAVLRRCGNCFGGRGVPMEEGFMLAFPERVLSGDVPNADFLHLYGPGSLWALAGWFKVFGVNLAAERWFGLIQLLGIVGGVAALARAWGRRLMVAAGVVCVIISFTAVGLAAMAWNGGLALLVCSVVALRRALDNEVRGTGWLVAAGALAGAALLFRPDLVLTVGLIAGVAVWLAGERRRLLWRAAAGLAAVGSLILVQVAMAGPSAAIEGMITQPVFDLRGGRALPVPPSWGFIDGFAQRVAMIEVPSWPLPMPAPPSRCSCGLCC
ncbi:MAG: acyltransferase family protein [Candidatus Microthrix sp.]|nr:acyltransferase family protein [Candidatus Microthrix sp.]